MTKIFYKNGLSDHIKVLEKSTECTDRILKAKKYIYIYILKMTTKLEHSNSAPKNYWTILNRLLYNKKIPAMPPLLVLFQTTAKKNIFLIAYFFHKKQ